MSDFSNQTDLFSKTKRDMEFENHHKENPHIYRELVKMARQAKQAGHERIGMSMLYEVLRWRTVIRSSEQDYKLNNNYQSRYARLIMEENPDLDGLFQVRGLKS